VAAAPPKQELAPEAAVAGVEQMVAEALKQCDLPDHPPLVAVAPLEQGSAPELLKQCDLPGYPPVVAAARLEQGLAPEVVKQCDLPGHPPVVASAPPGQELAPEAAVAGVEQMVAEVVKRCALPGQPPVVAALQQVLTTESPPAVVFLQVRIGEQPGVVSVLFLPVAMTQRNPTALGMPV
jgi:hypothetical protein